MTTPRRIEWTGPEGFTVWADEDGVHLRSRSGDSLESCDVDRLITVIHEAREQVSNDRIKPPKPPTREEIARESTAWRAREEAKRAARAVYESINPYGDTEGVPF